MRRHQILREELRQRRKHLEALMAEHQRRSSGPELQAASQALSRDERKDAGVRWLPNSIHCPRGTFSPSHHLE